MSRELIVSVNGREKKIAIVENERVTEFYIERGEQNQGIVVDKSKKGDAEGAARAAAEHIEIGRVQREQQVEATHERAEPLREVEPEAITAEAKPEEAAEEGGPRR